MVNMHIVLKDHHHTFVLDKIGFRLFLQAKSEILREKLI